jgi:hypothetical protein
VTTIVVHADKLGPTHLHTLHWLRDALQASRIAFIGRFDSDMQGDYVFATRRHRDFEPLLNKIELLQRVNLERFLTLKPTQNDGTFGFLEVPQPNAVVKGKLRVSGWALSPWGIERVELRFANGEVVVPALLGPRPDVLAEYPWYPMTTNPGFYMEFDTPVGSDLQVEIIDGRRKRHRLENVWFSWEP